MKICIASGNRGKIAELQKLLAEYITDVEIELVSLKDVGFVGDIEENGTTFEENALIKARAAAEFSGLCSIADDSGLIVNALDGEPGVYSARYGGDKCKDDIERYEYTRKTNREQEIVRLQMLRAKYQSLNKEVHDDVDQIMQPYS